MATSFSIVSQTLWVLKKPGCESHNPQCVRGSTGRLNEPLNTGVLRAGLADSGSLETCRGWWDSRGHQSQQWMVSLQATRDSQWSGAQGDGEGRGLTASPRTPGGGKDRTLSWAMRFSVIILQSQDKVWKIGTKIALQILEGELQQINGL